MGSIASTRRRRTRLRSLAIGSNTIVISDVVAVTPRQRIAADRLLGRVNSG